MAAARRSAAPVARHAGDHVGQTPAKVGADVVIDERIGAGVAIGETVAEHAEYGAVSYTHLTLPTNREV